MRRTRDRDLSEDLTADVFVRALTRQVLDERDDAINRIVIQLLGPGSQAA